MTMSEQSYFSKQFNTRMRIFNALEELIRDVALDKVKTADICKLASVSKSTFYMYFSDKYAIVQWYLDILYAMGVTKIGRTLTWEEGHRITTSGIERKKELFLEASKSTDYNAIDNYSVRKREAEMIKTLTEFQGRELTGKLHAQIISLAIGERAVTSRIRREFPDTPVDQIVEYLISIIPTDLYEALKTPALPAGYPENNPVRSFVTGTTI